MNRFSPCLCLAACALGMAAPAWAALDTTGVLMFGDPLITGSSLARNGTASACGALKPFPGTAAPTGLGYDEITYTHTGPSQCVTFQVMGNCAGPGVHLSAYRGAFDPANVATLYLGDSGNSSDNNIPRPLSLDLTDGQTVHLVVSNAARTAEDEVQACAYRLTSSAPTAIAPVPALGEWALLLTGLAAAGLGARRMRRPG